MSDAHMIFEWQLVATVSKDGMVELDVDPFHVDLRMYHDLGGTDVSLHTLEAVD